MDISLQNCEDLILSCDNQMIIKEKEKEYISASNLDEILKRVKISQIQAEIDELRSQRNYYADFFRDQMVTFSVNCTNCCCNGNCCYKY